MLEHEELYEEDWDSEEFQTALKVVIKCEIQSLLERLSATGEETVLLTASASQLCTGHLASPKARNFVKTSEIGNIKNKFLNFITGSTAVGSHTSQTVPGSQGTITTEPEIPAFLFNNYNPITKKIETVNKPVDNKSTSVNNQIKTVEKRPLESGQLSQTSESKRRKTEVSGPPGGKVVLDNSSVNVSSNVTFPQPSSSVSVTKLKTTKVVSKSGGFTEERLSDAEFQKILAQYKGSNSSQEDTESEIPSGPPPQLSQQKQLQTSAGTSKLNKTVSLSSARVVSPTFTQTSPNSQNIVNPSPSTCGKGNTYRKPESNIMKSDLKTSVHPELVLDKKSELEAENLPNQAANTVIEKRTDKVQSDKDRLASEGVAKKKEEKDLSASTSENRLDNIDNLDTETLIRMTKQKHFENMSEADREIQAKLGQLSSKLSWVVEYPKDAKGQKSGQGASGSRGSVQEGMAMPPPGPMHGPYIDNDEDEMDPEYDEDDEEDGEFNEDDLDEEDKATLRAMREAHLQKLRNSGNMEGYEEGELFAQGFGLQEGYEMGEGQMLGHDYDEHYDEEGEYSEEYDEYEDAETDPQIHRMMVAANERLQGPNMMPGLGKVSEAGEIPQSYVQASSPSAENFQMIGPIMAKCLICNKIIRKVEMKSHNENHLKQLPYDDDEEEDEEDIEEMQEVMGEQDGNHYGESLEEMAEGEEYADEAEYAENCGELDEDPDIEPEFIAEKFVAEKLVAEKVDASVENEDNKSFVCDICNKSLKTKASLLRHKKNIHSLDKEISEIQCPCCSKTFKTPTNFQKHLKKVHPTYEKTLQGEAHDGPETALGYTDNYSDNVNAKAVASSE